MPAADAYGQAYAPAAARTMNAQQIVTFESALAAARILEPIGLTFVLHIASPTSSSRGVLVLLD